jgi:hypothetical protein
MRRTALAILFVFVATAAVWAEGPDPAATTPQALGQALPTRARNEGCVLSPELQALLGSTRPPGYELEDRTSEGRICEIEIPICYLGEWEGDCYDGYVDTYNGGCNDPSEPFSILPESYGQPLVIWGTSGVFDGGSTRDTDWYEIELSAPTEISFSCIAEFPVNMFIIDGTAGCGGFVIVYSTSAPECTEGSLTATIGPGTFWFWVGASTFDPAIVCGSDYVMTIEGYQPGPCVLECPPGSVIEEEPVCEFGYDDFYNGGCNFVPQTFQPLDPSGGMIVVCGETGVYDHYTGYCYRDLDWYEITPAEPAEIQFCAAAEFDIVIILIQAGPDPGNPCSGSIQMDFQQAPACEAACIETVLDPGRYWLVVSTVNWLPLDCGSEYTMTLTGYTTAVEPMSWGTIKAIYR